MSFFENNINKKGEKLFARLRTPGLDETEIKQLAKSGRNKEDVLQHIGSLPSPFKGMAISQALDDSTQLGKFFAVQRGWLPTSRSRGTLAQLQRMKNAVIKLVQWSYQDIIESFALFTPTALTSIPKPDIPPQTLDINALTRPVQPEGMVSRTFLVTQEQDREFSPGSSDFFRSFFATPTVCDHTPVITSVSEVDFKRIK